MDEPQFVLKKKIILLLGGLGLFTLMLVMPTPEGISPAGQKMAAVAVLMALWWIGEAVPLAVTALMPLILYPLLGILPSEVVAPHYTNHLVFLFMGGFMIALAMEKWNFHKRIALVIIRFIGTSPSRIILGFMVATAFLSMWISNTATTMMMLPVAMAVVKQIASQASIKGERTGSTRHTVEHDFGLVLMLGLAYSASIGGIGTLIGTPPNIVIAEFRGAELGEPYRMFDFAPVGLACAVVGVAYVALIGWRLLPRERKTADAGKELFDLADYIAEVRVPEGSAIIGKRVRELDELAAKSDVEIVGLSRKGRRMPGLARVAEIKAGDVLVIEASPDSLEEALGALGLEYVGRGKGQLGDDDLVLTEVVVQETSRLVNRSSMSLQLLYRYRVALVGVSRQGRRFRENVRKLTLQPGDVLLLLGSEERLGDITGRLGLLPLADRGQRVIQRDKAWWAVGIFATAIVVASFGWVYLPIALGCATALYVVLNIVPIRDVYTSIEWPVIVLLGAMIPIGGALQSTGGTALIAGGIVDLSTG
ncbi:MAG: SLC13 family permease, partial [Nitrospinae bacterium]|nr:SLC13 family permease [Nitrospinota bacterium]